MPTKEWVSEFEGTTIKVVNTWLGGAKLYINGDCRDTNNDLTATKDTAILSARIEQGKPESPLVEIFIKAILTTKAKIVVNGKQIGGDVF